MRGKDRELYEELFNIHIRDGERVQQDQWEIICAWRDFIATLTFSNNELISDWENGVVENELRRMIKTREPRDGIDAVSNVIKERDDWLTENKRAYHPKRPWRWSGKL